MKILKIIIKSIKKVWQVLCLILHLLLLPLYGVAYVIEAIRNKIRLVLNQMQDENNTPAIMTITYIIQMVFVIVLMPYYIIKSNKGDKKTDIGGQA